jgi:hypothetical protein
MLSVILYGRNDSHGYNLHKRGAISLNAIAELLTDDSDEILFVDYNTPDDLPTFPEAIADTLTQKAWDRLKILRVRAAQHHRFAGKTHLNALEPIARNVAIRRSNPANRWVLSTNTDMVFVPHAQGDSLTQALARLTDGFYHLPRFELPEALWETLDRKDGMGIVESVRRWGTAYHLNEIVRSGGDNLFDGPGDFQLFLRQDLFQIGGFHEEMILGWHVDANIARRMRMLRGEVKSADGLLWGYHCDHTRQATPYHTMDRQENSPTLYVDNVQVAEVASQVDSFGFADEDVEVIHLGQGSSARYITALDRAMGAPMATPSEAFYITESYGGMAYNIDHVLPFLLDLVTCVPLDANIGYVGARRDMFDRFAGAWRSMGGTRPILTPAEADWLAPAPEALEGDPPLSVPVGMSDWAARADMFIFEIGAEQSQTQRELTAEERLRLWTVNIGFWSALDTDVARQRTGSAARRVLAVNAIHNYFERQVSQSVSAKLTPFSSRIRHGYFVDNVTAQLAQTDDAGRAVAAALSLHHPLSRKELKRLGRMVEGAATQLDQAPTWNDCRVMAAELIALIDARHAALGAVNPIRLTALRDALVKSRPSVGMQSIAIGEASRPSLVPSRLAHVEDWEDEGFLNMASRLFPGRDHADLFQRDLWVWERIALSYNLWRRHPIGARPTVLFIVTGPDLLPVQVSNLGAHVDTCDCETLIDGRLGSEDWRAQFAEDSVTTPAAIGLAQDRAADIAAGFHYDAIVIPQNAVLIRKRERFATVLRRAAGYLKPGGTIEFSARAMIGNDPPGGEDHALPPSMIFQARLARLISERTELALAGAIDWRITGRTLDRVSSVEGSLRAPPLVHGDFPYLETLAVFSFEKRDGVDEEEIEDGWRQVENALATGWIDPAALVPLPTDENLALDMLNGIAIGEAEAPDFGSVLRKMRTGRNARRTPRSIFVQATDGDDPALFGNLGGLPPGPYEIEVETNARTPCEARLILVRANVMIADLTLNLAPGMGKRQGGVFTVIDDGCDLGVAAGLLTPPGVEIEVTDFILR